MHSPTLALCIPAYKAAGFLSRLLESAVNQDPKFDEIWVYDDASPDETAAVAERFGAHVVRGENNVGCSVAKNLLAGRTTCDWIHFHDADDDILPGFVARARKLMDKPNCPDVVLFDYEYRDFENDELIMTRHFDDVLLRSDPIRYALIEQINPFCGLYKKSAFLRAGGYDCDPAVLYNEDCAFHLHIALEGLSFGAESGPPSIVNLRRSNSMSASNAARCVVARLALLKKSESRIPARLRADLASEAWLCARNLAYHRLPGPLSDAIALAQSLGSRIPAGESGLVRMACGVDPVWAFRLRAWFVRRRDVNTPSSL